MKIVIQSADGTVALEKEAKVEDAVNAFKKHNWDAEKKKQNELEIAHKEAAPACMVIEDAEGNTLKICHEFTDYSSVTKTAVQRKKSLGLIPGKSVKTTSYDNVSNERAIDMIRSFYASQQA